MNQKRQQTNNNSHPIHELSEIISPLRMGTYLQATGQDADRALALYLWNAKVSEAFHLPIQAYEVGLRNRVSDGLSTIYGTSWWSDPRFLKEAGRKREADIKVVLDRLASKQVPLGTGQVIAGLSFGFWVAMLHRRHHINVWSSELRIAFPHLPHKVDHKQLHKRSIEIADFRNRISHHEPIFKRNLLSDYGKCMEALSWICPTKAAWIKPHCRVAAMMREKP